MSDEQLSGIFATPYQVRDETTLRFAFAPERREEVIDPVRLDSSDLLDKLYELAHAPTVRLFSYKQSKMSELQGDSLVIVQSNSEYSHQETQETRLELAESGQLIVDTNVTGRTARQDRFDMSRMFLVAGDDIEAALRPAFAFAAALFNEIDPYERHQRFLYDTALTGIGQRRFTDTVPHSQNVYSMSLSGSDEPARAFETPRLVTRADLDTPDNEIKRILTMLARRMNSKSR